MKNTEEIKGTLEIIQRLPSSRHGNPRYLVKVGDTVCRTAPDAALGYGITNYEGKEVIAIVGEHYGKATVQKIKEVIA